MLRKLSYFLAGLLVTAGIAAAATNIVFSFGATWTPSGPALFQGSDFQLLTNAVETLRDQADGTTSSTPTGTFNGTVGATTPASGSFTTVAASGAITPTGGVAAAGGYSVSCRNFMTLNEPAIATTSGTNLDIVVTETYRAEIFVPATCSSTGIAVFNGTAVAGNLTAYLITSAGAQVGAVLTASTAASGTTAYQLIPWTGGPFNIVGPATYYLAVQGNNSGGDLRTHVLGVGGADKQTSTVYGTLTVAAAPTTFTTGLGVIATLY